MNRREFLKTLGLTAAAVSFAPSALADAPAVPPIAAIDEAALDEVLYVGDVFTIAGRYAVNPITGKTTSHLQRFIVTSVTSDRAELGFHPSLKTNTETWPKLNSDEVFGR